MIYPAGHTRSLNITPSQRFIIPVKQQDGIMVIQESRSLTLQVQVIRDFIKAVTTAIRYEYKKNGKRVFCIIHNREKGYELIDILRSQRIIHTMMDNVLK